MQDAIIREVVINADKETVYNAIANPEMVTKWFPDAIEGKYEKGGRPLFVFDGHGKAQMYVVDAKPHEYFAYQWIPGGSDFVGDVSTVPHTLVEFSISEVGDGTSKVVLSESGFASLPTEMAEKAFGMNSGGWDYFILDSFKKYFDTK
jgi:uncharacterized protein YndB with AHSA1/START domain